MSRRGVEELEARVRRYALMERFRATRGGAKYSYKRLRELWLARVEHLASAEEELARSTRQDPGGLSTGTRSRGRGRLIPKTRLLECARGSWTGAPQDACGMHWVCPRCWTARASEIWRKVDADLFAPREPVFEEDRSVFRTYMSRGLTFEGVEPVRTIPDSLEWVTAILSTETVHLPEYHRLYSMTGGRVLRELLSRRNNRSPRKRIGSDDQPWLGSSREQLLERGIMGGLESLEVGISPLRRICPGFSWDVTLRQLLFVDPGRVDRVVECLREPRTGRLSAPKVVSFPRLERFRLASLVGRALVYPALLFVGDKFEAVEALRGSRGIQLVGSLGMHADAWHVA